MWNKIFGKTLLEKLMSDCTEQVRKGSREYRHKMNQKSA